jgi:hypothetical protein
LKIFSLWKKKSTRFAGIPGGEAWLFYSPTLMDFAGKGCGKRKLILPLFQVLILQQEKNAGCSFEGISPSFRAVSPTKFARPFYPCHFCFIIKKSYWLSAFGCWPKADS